MKEVPRRRFLTGPAMSAAAGVVNPMLGSAIRRKSVPTVAGIRI